MCLTPFYTGRDAALPPLQKSRGENKHQAALYESISCALMGRESTKATLHLTNTSHHSSCCFAPPFNFFAPRWSHGFLLTDCLWARAPAPARSFWDFPCLLVGVSWRMCFYYLSHQLSNPQLAWHAASARELDLGGSCVFVKINKTTFWSQLIGLKAGCGFMSWWTCDISVRHIVDLGYLDCNYEWTWTLNSSGLVILTHA